MACAPSEDSDQPGHLPSLIKSSLCAQWVAKDPRFLHADSEDSHLSLHWAHTHFVGFVMSWLSYIVTVFTDMYLSGLKHKELNVWTNTTETPLTKLRQLKIPPKLDW